MTANPRKAGLIVVATIGDFSVTVHITMTSTMMKNDRNLDAEGVESKSHCRALADHLAPLQILNY